MLLKKTWPWFYHKKKEKKKKLVGFKNVSELDWGYAQFQGYINIKFYYRYFFP